MRVRPPLAGSCERLFHETGVARFLLPIDRDDPPEALRKTLLQRAIGVIYRPETERLSHYFDTRLTGQFDAILHFDDTRAVVPIDPGPTWHDESMPETWPSGL